MKTDVSLRSLMDLESFLISIIQSRAREAIKSFGSCLEEPKVEHVIQIQFYLNVLGIENRSIDYLNKLGFLHDKDVVDKRFQIQCDKSVYKMLIGRARDLFGAFMADIHPTARAKSE